MTDFKRALSKPCLAVLACLAAMPMARASTCGEMAPFGLPVPADADTSAITVCKEAADRSAAFFVTHYDRDKVAPRWVVYALTRTAMLAVGKSKITRDTGSVAFAADPAIEDQQFKSPTDADYLGIKLKGFDRGHYLPADAMKWSLEAYRSTFTVSNIALQSSVFNEGIWAVLENQERGWACDHQAIYAVTGVIFGTAKTSVFHSQKHPSLAIAIPTHFWKVIYTSSGGGKAIAFVFPNSKRPGSLASAVRSVTALEREAEMNFAPDMPAEMRGRIEDAAPDPAFWKLNYPAQFKCVPKP